MSIFDVALIVILSGFVFYGLFFGLVRMLGNLIGIIVGAFVASHFYLKLFSLIEFAFLGYENLGKVICFIVIMSLVGRLIGFATGLVEKTFNLLTIIPFLGSINKFFGAIVGFVFGALTLGLSIYVISKYALVETLIGGWLVDSQVVPFLMWMIKLVLPLLSSGLKMINGII